MLFGQPNLFGSKLEMILQISFLLVGDKKNDLENLDLFQKEKASGNPMLC